MAFRTKEEEKRRNRIESGVMDGENFNQNRIAGNGQRWVAKVPRVSKVPCKFLINRMISGEMDKAKKGPS